MSLPNLPLLENNMKKLENHVKDPDNQRNPSLPNLENNNFSNHLQGNFKSELMLTGKLEAEYRKIKNSYRELIYTFEKSLQKDMMVTKKETKLKDYKFKNLSDFENAVNKRILNLEDYNSKEINDLIKELNELENRLITRDLNEYNFKTIDEFQRAVDKGIIDLSRYDMKEVNELLNKLEDESLKLSDFDIVTFGNVKLPEIEDRINNFNRPVNKPVNKSKKEILREIKVHKENKALPTPPKPNYKNVKKQVELTQIIEDNDNIDEILESNFITRFIKKIKNILFKKRAGP